MPHITKLVDSNIIINYLRQSFACTILCTMHNIKNEILVGVSKGSRISFHYPNNLLAPQNERKVCTEIWNDSEKWNKTRRHGTMWIAMAELKAEQTIIITIVFRINYGFRFLASANLIKL